MNDTYEDGASGYAPEGGNVYQCIGAQGVVLEIHTYPDGSVALCTFHRDDTKSKVYGLKLSSVDALSLITLLIGSQSPGAGVN